MTQRKAAWRRAAAATLVAALAATCPAPAGSAQQAAPAEPIEIVHDPLPCLSTSTAPRVEATISPAARVASARVYWRIANGPPEFYYTAMSGTPRFQALLPRVTPAADAIEYYVEASDRGGETRRTPSYVAPLVTQGCIARGIVPLVAGLGLTIGLTDPGQPHVPRGVNPDDVANVVLPSGETVAAAAPRGSRRGGGAAGATGAAPKSGGIPKGVLIGAGALAVGGIAAAAGGGGGGGGGGTSGGGGGGGGGSATPTPTPAPTPTPTPSAGFRFVEAEATWSGPGDIDVLLLDATGQTVSSQTVPAGCESTASRTERVVLQGTTARPGGYQVRLTGKTCGPGTPASISTLLTVQTDTGPKCPSTFVAVPVGQTVAGCSFTLP